MKLSTKMAFGFGTLVVIAGMLGFIGWWGLNGVSKNVDYTNRGVGCQERISKCAVYRRDFEIQGFAPYNGETKNAADKWKEECDGLVAQLEQFSTLSGFSSSNLALAKESLTQVKPYQDSFDSKKAARKMQDDSVVTWGKIGREITANIEKAGDAVIKPARAAAEKAKDADGIIRWARINDSLNENFVQPFFLLRVNANLLFAAKTEDQWTKYQAQLIQVRDGLTKYQLLVKGDAKLEEMVRVLEGYIKDYETAGNQYHAGLVADRVEGAKMAQAAAKVIETIDNLEASLTADMQSISTTANTLMIFLAVGSMILGIILAFVITRSIVKPINRIIQDLSSGAEQVAAASGQVSSASQSAAQGASEQASSLEETSSALEEMAGMAKTNADNAAKANDLMSQTTQVVGQSQSMMGQTSEAMAKINDASGKIANIIKVIEEIAFQTNLLALNAAVEAARAGEHGKGFAVVADEVRNLAQRSAQAANETGQLISDTIERVKKGTELNGELGESFGKVNESSMKVAQLVEQITQASGDQAKGVEQINAAVGQMDQVVQQNAANAEESASASQELSGQAHVLRQTVNQLAALVGGNQTEHGATQQILSHPSSELTALTKARTKDTSAKLPSHTGPQTPIQEF